MFTVYFVEGFYVETKFACSNTSCIQIYSNYTTLWYYIILHDLSLFDMYVN